MSKRISIALTAIFFAAILQPVACRSAVETWKRWEQSLTSAKPDGEGDGDVTLRVNYSGPNQERIIGLGFWDGDRTFKIRCLFPKPGTWTWKTECSDSSDTGLHHQSGTVEVHPYSGSNPLYRHGYVQVSANRRYLEQADGKPFLWIGDTTWAAPMNAALEDWQIYLRDRREKGFTGLQVFCASDWAGTQDTEGNPPFLGEGLARPNPAYWRQYERKLQLANEEGFVVLVVGLMEPVKRYPDTASAQRFARYLVARLMGNFVIFSPSFDSPYQELGDAVGQAIRESSSLHLVLQHPGTDLPAAQTYHSKPYLDICGLQSGAGWGGNPLSAEIVAKNAVEWTLDLYHRQPNKPVINLECRYDSEFGGKQLARLPRSCGYWTLLSGAVGYTYGCAGVWNWGLKVTHDDPQASLWDWRIGMNRPSSSEMKYLAAFFLGLNWWELEPHHEVILNQSEDWTKRMVLAKSGKGDLAVAYLPDNPAITLEMSAFSTPMSWRWFNPLTGQYKPGEDTAENRGQKTLERPIGWEDALLELRGATFGSTPP